MKLEQAEYVTFNTNIVDDDVSLIAEYLLIVKEPNQSKENAGSSSNASLADKNEFKDFKRFGIGFVVLDIFAAKVPSNAKMLQGTPRSLLSGKNID